MGPFGIAAVGLLANKGSRSKHKQSSAREAKSSSRHANGEPQVVARVPDPESTGVFRPTPGLSMDEHGIKHTLKLGNYSSKSEIFDSSLDKEIEMLKLKGLKPGVSISREASSKETGKLLTLGLNHIKTRAPSESVRTVDSALDTSEGSSMNSDRCQETSPNDLRKQARKAPSRKEHTPIKLRRSGRIRPDVADTLLLNVQSLSIEEAVTGNEDILNKEVACNNVLEVRHVGPFTSDHSDVEHLDRMPGLLSSNDTYNDSIQSDELILDSMPSDSTAGLAVDSMGTESGFSVISVQAVEMYDKKETESPRFKALLLLTGGLSNRKTSADITSYSHELSTSITSSHPYGRFQNTRSSETVVDALQARFLSAKEQVDTELALFGADLLDIMELDEGKQHQGKQEDLLVLARECSLMPVKEFREQCEGIVQKLEEERQMLPLGRLKQLHTRLLFILTRCTRLLQYQKESGAQKDGLSLHKSGILGNNSPLFASKDGLGKRFYSQEQRVIDWRNKNLVPFLTMETGIPQIISEKSAGRKGDSRSRKPPLSERTNSRNLSSTAKTPIAALLPPTSKEKANHQKCEKDVLLQEIQRLKDEGLVKSDDSLTPRRRKRDPEDMQHVICRICEERVPTFSLEEHSHICALAVQCDVKGVSVDNRLFKLALILDKLIESQTPNSAPLLQGDSPDMFMSCAFNRAVSPKARKTSTESDHRDEGALPDNQQGSTDVLSFKGLFGSKSEQSRASSSVGSITPKSPIVNGSYFEVNLDDRLSLGESEDPLQIADLADIARCVASTNASEPGAVDYLGSCLKDLENLLHQSKDDALTIYTFGSRIEKLLRGKYLEVCEVLSAMKAPNHAAGGSYVIQDNLGQSTRPAPAPPSAYKDRTCIDDFEIIKPISRGAFGRVFLARKRATGDLFAIKVLRKADMIRKNAVESILAERDILISTRNPFVVRFFYSFTCTENLYLVMEYLVGGDLYSLLRNVGCLDETVSRVYIAELVLALEYLHSLGVVHRDLKPDNLLIAHDGHLKLTDFGLSKVGLINSTDDLSQPCSSGSLLPNGDGGMPPITSRPSQLREKRQKHAAVGTPDYLAPEILLGTGHGNSADWWSAGIILFECLTGVPPFNADQPQRIFENILNRKIPWPRVPEDMSADAKDLIDKLLTEDPNARIGAKGAAEVKTHPFFKDINWDTLARQKAAFVPTPESPHDTSYFTSRHDWSGMDGFTSPLMESAQPQCFSDEDERRQKVDEQFDQPGDLVDFSSSPSSRFSFSNFSFKNLSQLASINYDLLMQTTKVEPETYIQ